MNRLTKPPTLRADTQPPHSVSGISHGNKPLALEHYDKSPEQQKTAAEIDAIVADIDADRDSWAGRERGWGFRG